MLSMIIRRATFVFVVILLLSLVAGAQPALAHANLVRSEPEVNSAQKTSPPRVRLWFSEDIEPSFTGAHVLDSTGSQLDKGDAHRLPDDPKALELSLLGPSTRIVYGGMERGQRRGRPRHQRQLCLYGRRRAARHLIAGPDRGARR